MSRRLVYPFLALVVAAGIGGWTFYQNQQKQQLELAAQVESAILGSDQGALFAAIRADFPEEYAAFLQELTALRASGQLDGDLLQAVFDKSQAFTTQLRRENAHYIRSAPLQDIRALRRQTLEMLNGLADRPEACVRFGRFGGNGLQPDEVSAQDMARITRAAELTFAAIVAGRERPVTHPAPQPGDRAAFLAAWEANTAPSAAEVAAVKSGAGAPEDLCAAITSMEAYVLADTTPLTERMLVELTAASVGG